MFPTYFVIAKRILIGFCGIWAHLFWFQFSKIMNFEIDFHPLSENS